MALSYEGTRKDFMGDLKNVLYQHYNSIFPVLMERSSSEPYHPSVLDATQLTVNQRIFTKRVSASFLVVIPYYGQGKYEDTHSDIFSKYDMMLVRMFDKVLPDSFAYLVFPQTIWEGHRSLVNNLSIRRVPVKTVSFIKRKIFGIVDYLVPNYEQALMEILQETQSELWVHGVLHPTYTLQVKVYLHLLTYHLCSTKVKICPISKQFLLTVNIIMFLIEE